jgi:hypothetical protein
MATREDNFHLRLSEDDMRRLIAVAQDKQRSKSDTIRYLISLAYRMLLKRHKQTESPRE